MLLLGIYVITAIQQILTNDYELILFLTLGSKSLACNKDNFPQAFSEIEFSLWQYLSALRDISSQYLYWFIIVFAELFKLNCYHI